MRAERRVQIASVEGHVIEAAVGETGPVSIVSYKSPQKCQGLLARLTMAAGGKAIGGCEQIAPEDSQVP